MSLEPGQILDAKYRVGRLIGEGGMGTVYEGENSRIGRRVAIKVLHAQVASMPELVERFEREARAAARIGSPHVCDVLDLGDLPNGDRYIVMEYLDGVSFEDRLVERGKLTAAQLAPVAFELLEGLGTMHAARVVHRDLKPANVFLARAPSGRGEIVKILDFGVAKLQPFEGELGTMTQTGSMMGTPLYMSPEQARGARDVDGRTDIYAASVMFYRALAGVLPYTAETLNELLFKIVLEEPRPLRDLAPEVDEIFAAIVHKGLARDMEQRFQTAREYQVAIAAWGKTQGRASLSFALTMTSERPVAPAVPGDVSPVMPVPVPATKPVTRSHEGTPTAWSEDGPEAARRASSQSNVAVRPAAGAPSAPVMRSAAFTPPLVPPPLQLSPATSTVAMQSEPPFKGPWSEGPGAIPAEAITSPKVELLVPAARAGNAPQTAGSRRALAIGVGAAGALAGAGILVFLAFGRPATAPPPSPGLTPTAAEATATAPPTAAPEPTSEATATEARLGPLAEAGAIPVIDPPAANTGARRERPVAASPGRRGDPKPLTPTASATAAPAAVASAVAPTPPTAPKPAASTPRKFRTNLD